MAVGALSFADSLLFHGPDVESRHAEVRERCAAGRGLLLRRLHGPGVFALALPLAARDPAGRRRDGGLRGVHRLHQLLLGGLSRRHVTLEEYDFLSLRLSAARDLLAAVCL